MREVEVEVNLYNVSKDVILSHTAENVLAANKRRWLSEEGWAWMGEANRRVGHNAIGRLNTVAYVCTI